MNDKQQKAGLLLDWLSRKPRQVDHWPSLLSLASETLTIGEFAEVVLEGETSGTIPPLVLDLLTDVRGRARMRNRRLTSQLSEVVPCMNTAGVEPIIMKGMARLLGQPGERSRLISDIDLLVPAQRHDACTRASLDLGYKVRKDCEHSPGNLQRPVDVGEIDLHVWVPPHYLGLDFERLRPHCRSIEIGGGRALLPTPSCQLLLFIVHDQLHDTDYWRGVIDVRHLIDIGKLVREGIDWDLLDELLPPGPARRALHVQLRTARHLLGIQFDPILCGGRWSEVQCVRRQYQASYPWLLAPFTLLTLLLEPPRHPSDLYARTWRQWVWNRLRRARRYLRPPGIGKLRLT